MPERFATTTFEASFGPVRVNPRKGGGVDGVFPRAGRAALRDFPRAKPEGNPEEQPCHPEENPVPPEPFTLI